MREKPLLFSAPMVRAILDGTKTQTRRIIKSEIALDWLDNAKFNPEFVAHPENDMCKYGKIGDQLWVRENYSVTGFYPSQDSSTEAGSDIESAACRVKYLVDGVESYFDELSNDNDFGVDEEQQAFRASKKKSVPSIHMPRWASRINLEITNIRIERLNDISDNDAEEEGIDGMDLPVCDDYQDYWFNYLADKSDEFPWFTGNQKDSFKSLWESINGLGSWDQNPWVWVIDFKKL